MRHGHVLRENADAIALPQGPPHPFRVVEPIDEDMPGFLEGNSQIPQGLGHRHAGAIGQEGDRILPRILLADIATEIAI